MALLLWFLLPLAMNLLIRQSQYDSLGKQRDQHHLASLLCAVAAGQEGHDAKEIVRHLDRIARNRFDRQLRLRHAVWLVRRSAPASLQVKVDALVSQI